MYSRGRYTQSKQKPCIRSCPSSAQIPFPRPHAGSCLAHHMRGQLCMSLLKDHVFKKLFKSQILNIVVIMSEPVPWSLCTRGMVYLCSLGYREMLGSRKGNSWGGAGRKEKTKWSLGVYKGDAGGAARNTTKTETRVSYFSISNTGIRTTFINSLFRSL